MDQGPAKEALFDRLVNVLADVLPDFGERLVIDSKAIPSWAARPFQKATPSRRDTNADYGKKDYRGQRHESTGCSKVVTRLAGSI